MNLNTRYNTLGGAVPVGNNLYKGELVTRTISTGVVYQVTEGNVGDTTIFKAKCLSQVEPQEAEYPIQKFRRLTFLEIMLWNITQILNR